MMFQKKIDGIMDWLKEKNNLEENQKGNIEFEKNDIMAIILSAILVFSPILLILIIIMIIVSVI